MWYVFVNREEEAKRDVSLSPKSKRPMHFYGLIFDLGLSPAFLPLGQRLPLLERRHEHLVIICRSGEP